MHTVDLDQVIARAGQLKPYTGRYLARARKLNPDVITAFDVREVGRGNACFLHRSSEGVTGWEAKNEGHTGFSTGGLKTRSWHMLGPKVKLKFV